MAKASYERLTNRSPVFEAHVRRYESYILSLGDIELYGKVVASIVS